MMKRFLSTIFVASMALFILAACGSGGSAKNDEEKGAEDDGKLKVVASFTIISDMAREIGGDKVDVHNLVPTGTDPHEYEPLPEDMKKYTDADILFYNVLNIEGRKNG